MNPRWYPEFHTTIGRFIPRHFPFKCGKRFRLEEEQRPFQRQWKLGGMKLTYYR
jgi:hypothetical protein